MKPAGKVTMHAQPYKPDLELTRFLLLQMYTVTDQQTISALVQTASENKEKDHAKKLKQQTNKLLTIETELSALESRCQILPEFRGRVTHRQFIC